MQESEVKETEVTEPPAQETSEEKTFSLAEQLAQATEKKEPQKPATEEKKASPVKNKFWGDDDFESPRPAAPEKAPAPEAPKSGPLGGRSVTDAGLRLSASNAVGMLDFTQKTLLTPLLLWKFKRKMGKLGDPEYLELLQDKNTGLTEEESRKKAAMDRLFSKYEKAKGDLPLKPQEKEELEDNFYNYFKYKQTELPPSIGLWFGIANTFGKRVIDVAFD